MSTEDLKKAGAVAILGFLLYQVIHLNYKERATNDARLHLLMERQTEAVEASQDALETLVRIYSGE